MLLEKILEEDSSAADDFTRHSNSSHNDKRHLLGNGHPGSVHVTNI